MIVDNPTKTCVFNLMAKTDHQIKTGSLGHRKRSAKKYSTLINVQKMNPDSMGQNLTNPRLTPSPSSPEYLPLHGCMKNIFGTTNNPTTLLVFP